MVDSGDKPIGRITLGTLRQARIDRIAKIEDLPLDEAFQVHADEPIGAVIPLMAASDNTVAVVDSDDRLVGEVPRVELLKALVSKEAKDGGH